MVLLLLASLLTACGDTVDPRNDRDTTPSPTSSENAPTAVPNPTGELLPSATPTGDITPSATPTTEVTPSPEPTAEITPSPELTGETTPSPELTGELTPSPEPTGETTPPVTTDAPTPKLTAEVTPAPSVPVMTKAPTPKPTGAVTPQVTPVGPGPEPTGTITSSPDPTGDATPPVTPEAPTPELTGELTPSPDVTVVPPTPTDTPTPTPTPFGVKGEDYDGEWYAGTITTDAGETECGDSPEYDYRLFIGTVSMTETSVRLEHFLPYEVKHAYYTETHVGRYSYFTLKTTFDDTETALYRSWGKEFPDLIANPSNLSKGHLVFALKYTVGEPYPDGTLLIIDAQQNGTLHVEIAYVLDGMPVFTKFTMTKPDHVNGTEYNDYLGAWYCTHYAYYMIDGDDVSDGNYLDARLVFNDDETMEFQFFEEDGTLEHVEHYERRTAFSAEEIAIYKEWDRYGTFFDFEHIDGCVAGYAENPPSLKSGKMLFVRTDEEGFGTLLSLAWCEPDPSYGSRDFYIAMERTAFDSVHNSEDIMCFTFKRYSYLTHTAGTSVGDFFGKWYLTEFREESDTLPTSCDNPKDYAVLQINSDMTATEYLGGEVIGSYAIRTKKASDDPAWYGDYNLKNVVTDFSKHRLVLKATADSACPGMLIVIDMNEDGTIVTMSYGKNEEGSQYHPYRKYERETGVYRRE